MDNQTHAQATATPTMAAATPDNSAKIKRAEGKPHTHPRPQAKANLTQATQTTQAKPAKPKSAD
ncbi:hypothetical protein [Boudabousia marimammalium]|uniref:hypothetical protein n=1 Tax=Boudabousia marimammalium TaxID=156892 RepID=UPI000AB65BC5|nr:hypothetical protein [Boudabousia marimammalium]